MAEQPQDATGARQAASLRQEHAVLRSGVASRADPVLRAARAGRWPKQELSALVDYLHVEVLRQIVDEEWLLFRSVRDSDQLAGLRTNHLELRLSIDALTEAATARGALTPGQLAAIVIDLRDQIEDHLAAEETVLAGRTAPPGVTSLGARPHTWYELTGGPIIDLDQLTGEQGADAVLDRLLRLRPGERVELHASGDPRPLYQPLRRTDPGGWGIVNLETGPPRWRVAITRRPPEPPLSPAAG